MKRIESNPKRTTKYIMTRIKFPSKTGFTLVELSLSLVFISALALMLILLTSNLISAYRKSLTISAVNSTGQVIIDDLRSSITGGSLQTALKNTGGNNISLIPEKTVGVHSLSGNITIKGRKNSDGTSVTLGNILLGGVFCTGSYSYVWNSGYLKNSDLYQNSWNSGENVISLKYGDKAYEDFGLLKVSDIQREVCQSVSAGNSGYNDLVLSDNFQGHIKIVTSGSSVEPEDLLISTDPKIGLAIYDLTALTPQLDPLYHSALYSGSFILGTVDGGVNIQTDQNYCETPSEYNSNFDYCAINRFNFAIRSSA